MGDFQELGNFQQGVGEMSGTVGVGVSYVFAVVAQIPAFPFITAGCAKTLFATLIVRVCGADEPQTLTAAIVIFPLVTDAVVEIEFVVEVPVQPKGKVHK